MPFPLDPLLATLIGGLLVNALTAFSLYLGKPLLRWALLSGSVLSARLSVGLRWAADRLGPVPC
ncbi:MAG: hypothetical protein Q8P18_01935 [Pseudomonadota bacterium]|nr:hypothetical protein [Pseudomonadota bacterium]